MFLLQVWRSLLFLGAKFVFIVRGGAQNPVAVTIIIEIGAAFIRERSHASGATPNPYRRIRNVPTAVRIHKRRRYTGMLAISCINDAVSSQRRK
ncbi:hypothetical protein IE985_00420 [Klebsiella pneumoniae]|nr:hypothetical protein [Klebsiella pneumoniae]